MFLVTKKIILTQKCDQHLRVNSKETQDLLIKFSAKKLKQGVIYSIEKSAQQIHYIDSQGCNALMHACYNGHQDITKLLLNKVNINIQNHQGWSALTMEISTGRDEIIEIILQRKDLDINIKNQDGITPLIYACSFNHKKIISLLLHQKSIEINRKSKNSSTALMLACQQGNTKIISLLLQHNSDVNIKSKNGCSALMYA